MYLKAFTPYFRENLSLFVIEKTNDVFVSSFQGYSE